MIKNKYIKKGFTLIELLVVVAVIGILASIILSSVAKSRTKGADAAIKSNISTLRSTAEIFYLDNNNSYIPNSGVTFGPATCPLLYDAGGTNMLTQSKVISEVLNEISRISSNTNCYNSSNTWAIAVSLKLDPTTSWCADSAAAARIINFTPDQAFTASFTCKP